MKRLLCIILTAALVITPASIASAKQHKGPKENPKKTTQQENVKIKEKKQTFKINGSPVIKYGKYKLPISPITKGMGAKVAFNKETAVLTVTKEDKTIIIDFKNKTVTVNDVADTKSGIFTAKNNKKTTVLIQYIGKALGVKVSVDDDDVIVTVPGLDYPTNITITTDGQTIVTNTLNSTTLSMSVAAAIKAGQATGGKAELYVGNKLVATDSEITVSDTSVSFTTSDGSPTNAELQVAVPTGGAVSVKLYNATNSSVTSVSNNPTLTVDYVAPVVTGINSAVYSVSGSAITLNYNGTSSVGDKVDVTKISFFDATLGKTYQLTNALATGSVGTVTGSNTIVINLGTADKVGLAGFGGSTVYLNVNSGSLIVDAAGNTSPGFTAVLTIPVTVLP